MVLHTHLVSLTKPAAYLHVGEVCHSLPLCPILSLAGRQPPDAASLGCGAELR